MKVRIEILPDDAEGPDVWSVEVMNRDDQDRFDRRTDVHGFEVLEEVGGNSRLKLELSRFVPAVGYLT